MQEDKAQIVQCGIRNGIVSGLMVAAICALLVVLYHIQGNTTDVDTFSRSVLKWMVIRWGDATLSAGDYSHGWLIPMVSIYALWRKRRELVEVPKDVFWPGLLLVILGLFLHWVGARVQQPRLSLASLVLLLWCIPLFLNGRKVGEILLFPCFYLVFCIPMNFFDSFSFSLRIIANIVSTALLNGVGIAVERSGSAMFFINRDNFGLDVADPCSGIRSLLAMTALTAAYAYFTQRVFWKQAVLFVSAFPLAIAGNIARITSIGIVVQLFGQDRALKFYHDYSGYIVFVAAILIMFAIEAGLNRIGRGQTAVSAGSPLPGCPGDGRENK